MAGSGRKFIVVAAALVLINLAGLIWIHHDLTRVPVPVVRITSALPTEDVDRADRFVLAFDRPMVSEEKAGAPEEGGLFMVQPAWPGTWQWRDTATLEYLLEKPLPPGRVFTVSASDAFEERTGKRLDGETTFRFSTRALVVTHCMLTSSDDRNVTFTLNFNQTVDPADLLRHMSVVDGPSPAIAGASARGGGKTEPEPPSSAPSSSVLGPVIKEVTVLTAKPDNVISVRIPHPSSGHFVVILDERLAGHRAELPLGREVVRCLVLSPRLMFESVHVDEPGVSERIGVRLRFTKHLGGVPDVSQLKTSPEVSDLRAHTSGRDLVLSGPFKPGAQYVVSLPATLATSDGETLGKEQSVTVDVPGRRPTIQIPHWRGVLSPHGNLTLDMRVVNIGGLRVCAQRVHANNLVYFLGDGSYRGTARGVLEKTLALGLEREIPQDVVLDLKTLLGKPLGVYYIRAEATDHRWTDDSVIVSITDLAITTRRERDGSVAWVTSLRTGKPVAGAAVRAYSYNNQVLATDRTDDDGIAWLRYPDDHPDGRLFVIVAEKDGDVSYVKPDESQWVLDGVDTSGRPYASAYEVMCYTERGVYRPGDVVHFTGIIRDRDGNIPPAFPLEVSVKRPDGRVVHKVAVTPPEGEQGVFHLDYPTRDDGQTGRYTLRVTLPGSRDVLGETHTLVEAFLPVRMEVTAKAAAARFGPMDVPKIDVSARYLWNQPGADLPLSIDGTFNPVAFTSSAHSGYVFETTKNLPTVALKTVSAVLDAQGKAAPEIALPGELKPALYRMNATVTVTEPGGRSVSAGASTLVDRLDRHVGLRIDAGDVIVAGKAVSAVWLCLDTEGQPARAEELKRTLLRVEYDCVVKKTSNGGWVWQSVERTETVAEADLAPGEKGAFEFTCPGAGMYRLVIARTGSDARTEREFYVSDSADEVSVPMNRPERLEIVTDRPKYAPGDMARVLVRSPIPGTMLLTVESDRVLWTRVVTLEKNAVSLDVPLPASLRGGAYLAASVVRPVDPTQKNWLPHRAMGMTRVVIDHAPQHLPVKIIAPAKAEPADTMTVIVESTSSVDPARPAVVHLWAVDEGILLTTAYRTPDAEAFFLNPRRPGVSAADLFYSLLPDFERPVTMARIGADGGDADLYEPGDLRTNPMPARRRAPAVVWRQAVPLGEDGRVTVEMKLPDLTGQLRLMAVAVDHDRYGSARHDVTLTTALIVESTWPRAAAPGDTFEVPVKLFNTTDAEVKVRVTSTVSAHVEVGAPGPGQADAALDEITIAPGKPVTRFLKVKAIDVGAVSARIDVTQLVAEKPLTAKSEAEFTVRPASALHTEVRLLTLEAGKELSIALGDDFVPGAARVTVEVSAAPSLQLAPALEALIGYPYGCVEQTTSRLYALVHAAGVLGSERAESINGMVQAGVYRLWSMQTRSGGLSYWPGGTTPCLWGSTYAAGCLLDAKSAGHPIDERFIRELVRYLESELRRTDYDVPDLNTKAFICRVLAVFGEPPAGWMSYLAERTERLDLAGRCHLAAAFAAAGRKDRAMAVLPAESPRMIPTTTSEERLTSRTRQEAVWLSVLLEIDPANAIVVPLASRLEKARTGGRWYSTLDNAAAIAALSRYQAMRKEEDIDFRGTLRAGSGASVAFDHTKPLSQVFSKVDGPVTVASTGKGTIYVVAAIEGPAKPGVVAPYNRDLTVTRRWLDRKGVPIDPAKLRVGDLVRVEVSVVSPRDDVHNVAVLDVLPGGMEVENPRLAVAAKDGSPGGDRPDHVEFLDDRVVLFCSAGKTRRTYRYALRVTTAGDFDAAPIQASCMYDPSVASLGERMRVTIAK